MLRARCRLHPFFNPVKRVDGPAIECNMNDFFRSCPYVNKDRGVVDLDPMKKFDVNIGYPKANETYLDLMDNFQINIKIPQGTNEVSPVRVLSPGLHSS